MHNLGPPCTTDWTLQLSALPLSLWTKNQVIWKVILHISLASEIAVSVSSNLLSLLTVTSQSYLVFLPLFPREQQLVSISTHRHILMRRVTGGGGGWVPPAEQPQDSLHWSPEQPKQEPPPLSAE